MRPLLFFLFIAMIVGCTSEPIDTTDVKKVYKYWTGKKPAAGITLIEGQCWRSPYVLDESTVFLHMRANTEKKADLIEKYSLLENEAAEDDIPSNAPTWFDPGEEAVLLTPNGGHTGPFFWENTITGDIYIYEMR